MWRPEHEKSFKNVKKLVTLAPVLVTLAPVLVTLVPVLVTLAPVLVTLAPVLVTLAPVLVTLAPVLVTLAAVLTYFDVNKPLTIQCDSSEKGMVAVLLRDSRALREAETRYAQIEKELLAIVWSLERFQQCTFGKLTVIQSDHKPLGSLTRKPLSKSSAPTSMNDDASYEIRH